MRGKEIFTTTFMFALLVLVIMNFAMRLDEQIVEKSSAGILWIAIIFSGAISMNRSMLSEKEEECLSALMMAPIERSAIYFGKTISSLVVMLATITLLVPVFTVLYNVNVMNNPLMQIFSFFLGSLGFISVGTIVSAISVNLRAREMMGPLLLLPLVSPLVIAAVKLTGGLIEGASVESLSTWINILVSFDVIYLVIGWLLFDQIIDD